ncbi:MAG: hypothetical protein A3F74_02305 [Betaproteobacteria bacterium RIFCSPLOWO2_12_FULL_62_58]|nr:MAG: hypothetical protein A3F74_02305 [Betaproteobacteria bacterium RIFCSPLOWO2_12_FULL_62_58]
MSSRDLTMWMWAEACRLLEQAERRHRQFFRLGDLGGAQLAWEPPVDIFEDEGGILIVVALPGVPAERIEVSIDARTVVVRARRQIPFGARSVAIHRLEIPHGYFERRIQLPATQLELGARELIDGCLILSMRKVR